MSLRPVYVLIYSVLRKKTRIAQRVMVMLMAMGMWNSQSICVGKQTATGTKKRLWSYYERLPEVVHSDGDYVPTDEASGHGFMALVMAVSGTGSDMQNPNMATTMYWKS